MYLRLICVVLIGGLRETLLMLQFPRSLLEQCHEFSGSGAVYRSTLITLQNSQILAHEQIVTPEL